MYKLQYSCSFDFYTTRVILGWCFFEEISMNTNNNTKKITILGLMCAISLLFMYLVRISIFPVAPFLEYDPADIPIFFITFLYGPVYGIYTTVVVSVLQSFTVSAQSGWIGGLMHILGTGSYVIIAGSIFKKSNKSFSKLILSAVCGTIIMTAIMIVWNLVFTPIYMETPVDAVLSIMLPAIIPFNLLRGAINSVLAIILYKSLHKYLK